jgi:two-component system secretion response regulator SsrB
MDCVLLADRHRNLSEGVCGLLGAKFESVFMVADQGSLLEGAERIQPTVVVAELSLAGGDLRGFLSALRRRAPAAKVLLTTVHDEPTVITAALSAGADAVVVTRAMATDLLEAVEAILAGKRYASASRPW